MVSLLARVLDGVAKVVLSDTRVAIEPGGPVFSGPPFDFPSAIAPSHPEVYRTPQPRIPQEYLPPSFKIYSQRGIYLGVELAYDTRVG